MNHIPVFVKQGVITSFDAYSGKGEMRIEKDDMAFDETCFRSGRPIRPPVPGESVDAIFTSDDGKLLSIRARE